MKRIAPLLGGAYLVLLGWYGTRYFGADWRRDLLVALIGPYIVASVVAHYYERDVRRHIDTLDPRAIDKLRATEPPLAEFLDDRPRINERVDWAWRATDMTAGVAFIFYPPLIYTVWRYRELRGETPVDGVAILFMLLGGASYLYWRHRRLVRYNCPGCRSAGVRLAGERIRFSCMHCGVTWQLGARLIGDPA